MTIHEDVINNQLRTVSFGRTLLTLEKCASTNDVAAEHAEQGAPNGFTVLAEEQTAGRGRRGRVWLSPPGGVWMTIVIRPPLHLETLNALPLLGALAIIGPVNKLLRRTVFVRWPNDVVVKDGRKLAGVLSETRFRGNELEYVILGLGINANFRTSMVSEINSNPITLLDLLGSSVDRERLACSVLFEAEKLYQLVEAGRGFSVLKELEKRDWSRGKSAKITLPDEIFVGLIEGYDDMSRVRVRVHDLNRLIETSSVLSVEYV